MTLTNQKLDILFTLLPLTIFLLSCSDGPTQPERTYNPIISKVIEAHGGIDAWDKQNTLSFALGNQQHSIDLKTRNIKIEAGEWTIGSKDGTVWIEQDSNQYKGSPRFYHSLMFYFHTMPFVFADEGIFYEEVADQVIREKNYKGIKMTFADSIGDAPKDQYILYYDPETYQMQWLAYNSTFSSQKKSDRFNLIHYQKWETSDGFLLPTELQWYKYEDGQLGEARGDAKRFTEVKVTEKTIESVFFDIPEGAEVDDK